MKSGVLKKEPVERPIKLRDIKFGDIFSFADDRSNQLFLMVNPQTGAGTDTNNYVIHRFFQGKWESISKIKD